jgi:hypothetical protein
MMNGVERARKEQFALQKTKSETTDDCSQRDKEAIMLSTRPKGSVVSQQ